AASGSVTIGGQGEQSHAATTATGSVNIQQVGQGWASVNQPYWGCVLWFDDGGCATMGWVDNYVTVYDSGGVTVGADSCSKSVGYDSSSAPTTLANLLAAAINADSGCVVSASVSGTMITFISRATGATANYSIVASSSSDYPQYFSPMFVANPSGSGLTGGQNVVYDSGTVTVTVNGQSKTVSYGSGSTSTSIAAVLAAAIAGDANYPVTATQNGATVNVSARIAGAVGNGYGLTGGTTYNSITFSSPSFVTSVSGAALAG